MHRSNLDAIAVETGHLGATYAHIFRVAKNSVLNLLTTRSVYNPRICVCCGIKHYSVAVPADNAVECRGFVLRNKASKQSYHNATLRANLHTLSILACGRVTAEQDITLYSGR